MTDYYGLTSADLSTIFRTGELYIGKGEATLHEIVDSLKNTYYDTFGAELTHIADPEQHKWPFQRLESVRGRPGFSAEVRARLLERLTAAEGLEEYLGTKYLGTRRFNLEGGESLILMADEIIQRCGSYGAEEIVIGMAHRGRLNALINTLGRNPHDLSGEFEGKKIVELGSGNMKYHQGSSPDVMTCGDKVYLVLVPNPSHLEIVSLVVEGSVRVRQDRCKGSSGDKVTSTSVHDDAAFAGQGVAMETFQMSQTRAYKTSGITHLAISSQVGFTTSRQDDARPTEYATGVAKMIRAPTFHINGDDPEAMLFVTQLVVGYHMQFKRGVVIDLVRHRRRGHNEADEPSDTQPLMYQQTAKQRTTRGLCADALVNAGVLSAEQVQSKIDDYRDTLDNGLHTVKSLVKEPNEEPPVDWRPYLGHAWTTCYDTRFDPEVLQELSGRMLEVLRGFVVQRQVSEICEDRQRMMAGGLPINWGFAETLVYATLLFGGHPVRMTGRDAGHGAFSHHHTALYNQEGDSVYVPLANLSDSQPRLDTYDSLLSKEAALAFEYGFATTAPNSLVVQEAQSGGLANGAQAVIDQFITSGEGEWGRLYDLTMLLPYGYRGQGPKHSSARLKCCLQLCAEQSTQIYVLAIPAQICHVFRRQVTRPLREPLVVITPKSPLRYKLTISTLEDLTNGPFQTAIPEIDSLDPKKADCAVLCSGKVYYNLLEKCHAEGREDIAIVRIERLYPFPEDDPAEALTPCKNLKHIVWCQREPMSQGAQFCSRHHVHRIITARKRGLNFGHAGCEGFTAPVCGYASMHAEQQEELLQDAFTV